MATMVRWTRVVVSALVVAGVVVSGVATCTAGAMMPETAQMACCKAGHHTCGPNGAPADCCKKTSSSPQQWTVAKTDLLKAPLRLFLASLTPTTSLAAGAFLVQPSRGISASPSVRPPGPPLYLVFSTLLI